MKNELDQILWKKCFTNEDIAKFHRELIWVIIETAKNNWIWQNFITNLILAITFSKVSEKKHFSKVKNETHYCDGWIYEQLEMKIITKANVEIW